MFEEINNQRPSQGDAARPAVGLSSSFNPAVNRPAEDILAGVDEPAKPTVFQPKPTPPANYDLEGREIATDPKKFFVLGAIIIAAILIIAGIFWGIKAYLDYRTASKGAPIDTGINVNQLVSPEQNINMDTSNASEMPAEEMPAGETAATGTEEVTANEPLDSDQDGLTDEEEQQLGTDPNSVDSDNDGLFDREEVKVYHTDPLNADTDGDGYLDGAEVKSGYDPKGPGRLYEIK